MNNSYWVIKYPDGSGYHVWSFRDSKRWAIMSFLVDNAAKIKEWKKAYRRGYRCVRLTVKETVK